MRIMPINNIQNNNQNSFKAKFRKQDVNEFLREIEGGDIDIVPKLYTMLDFVKNQAGQIAEIEHIGMWHRILIDGKSVNSGNKYFNAFHALLDATVKTKNTLIKETPIERLSEDKFQIECYKNSKKTKKDIENLFA